MTLTAELIKRYDKEGPRYTSYPTAPNWQGSLNSEKYQELLKSITEPVSLYVHIPFCEKRCFFCACNVTVKKQKAEIGDTYIRYLAKELDFLPKIQIKHLHLGGGTPTYLSDTQLTALITQIKNASATAIEEIAIEADPRTLTEERLIHLRALGITRLSLGIQDLDPSVHRAINRYHTLATLQPLFQIARKLQIRSINTDLIYGLPNQTLETLRKTLQELMVLSPDRIALYSFAYLPKSHGNQRGIKPEELPSSEEKITLYLAARDYLLQQGYIAIAMDHFAKETDELAIAYANGTMTRTFMGYTTKTTEDYIGIGVSAIGFIQNHFIQNTKELSEYYEKLDHHELPIVKSHALSDDDKIRQYVINSFMCQLKVDKQHVAQKFHIDFDDYFQYEAPFLCKCEQEKLLKQHNQTIQLTGLGRLFVRNICMGFDAHLTHANHQYSRTI